MLKLILIANAIWFGMAFHVFALRSKIFAKTLVPREHRDTPVFDVLIETGKFVGGFNLAFCILNVLILIYSNAFTEGVEKIILFSVFAIAHATQFFANIPIALANRKGRGAWPVKGRMLFIFITDFVMMTGNLIVVAMFI